MLLHVKVQANEAVRSGYSSMQVEEDTLGFRSLAKGTSYNLPVGMTKQAKC